MRWIDLSADTRERLLAGIPEADLNIPPETEISQVGPIVERYRSQHATKTQAIKRATAHKRSMANLKPFTKGKSGNPKGRPSAKDDGERLITALKNGHLAAAQRVILKYSTYFLTENPGSQAFTSGARAVKSAQEKQANV